MEVRRAMKKKEERWHEDRSRIHILKEWFVNGKQEGRRSIKDNQNPMAKEHGRKIIKTIRQSTLNVWQ